MTPGVLLEALLLGLSSGPVCLASCAPVLLPALAAEPKPARGSAMVLAQFLAGRLAGYLGFACIAWLAGVSLALAPRTRAALFGAADLALCLLLAGYAVALRGAPAGCDGGCRARRYRAMAPAYLGLATGLSLCPPFVAAAVRAAAGGGLAFSLLFFTVFFAGTAVWLAPSLSVALLRRFAAVAIVARFLLLLLAGYYGYRALVILLTLVLHAT